MTQVKNINVQASKATQPIIFIIKETCKQKHASTPPYIYAIRRLHAEYNIHVSEWTQWLEEERGQELLLYNR